MQATAAAAILFYPSLYYMTFEIGSGGLTFSSNIFTFHLIFGCHIVTIFRLVYQTYRGKWMLVFGLVDLLVVGVILLVIIEVGSFNNSVYEVSVVEMFTNTSSLTGFFLSTMVAFLLDWGVWETYHIKKFFPIYSFIKKLSQTNRFPSSVEDVNSVILLMFSPKTELEHVVRYCFGLKDGSFG